ncbi:MAG: hypothetical protein RR131_04950 [Anaerovorax sp.]
MKDRTQHRVEQVITRTKKLRCQREKHLIQGLSAICILLTVGLMGMFDMVANGLYPGTLITGAFGTALLWGKADAYVLTGVLSFTAGSIITVLCFRMQRKKKHSGETKDKKNQG